MLNSILEIHTDNDITILEAIQEYSFRKNISLEDIIGQIQEDSMFKELMHIDLLKHKYIKPNDEDGENLLSMWG